MKIGKIWQSLAALKARVWWNKIMNFLKELKEDLHWFIWGNFSENRPLEILLSCALILIGIVGFGAIFLGY